MTQYLLTVMQPTEGTIAPADLDRVMQDVSAVDQEMRDAGVWVFAGGLHPPSTATVLRPQGDDVLMTDGPFAEGKEHVGGFTIVEAEDLDAVLRWAERLTRITTLPVEVRPFRHGS